MHSDSDILVDALLDLGFQPDTKNIVHNEVTDPGTSVDNLIKNENSLNSATGSQSNNEKMSDSDGTKSSKKSSSMIFNSCKYL